MLMLWPPIFARHGAPEAQRTLAGLSELGLLEDRKGW